MGYDTVIVAMALLFLLDLGQNAFMLAKAKNLSELASWNADRAYRYYQETAKIRDEVAEMMADREPQDEEGGVE